MCGFLARQKEWALNGIIYRSVQTASAAKNIVLFHHAARVEEVVLPPGAKISSGFSQMSDDDEDMEYQVTVEHPAEDAAKQTERPRNIRLDYVGLMRLKSHVVEAREVSLRLDLTSLEVPEVQAVAYSTSDFKVHRYEFPRRTTLKAPAAKVIDVTDLL